MLAAGATAGLQLLFVAVRVTIAFGAVFAFILVLNLLISSIGVILNKAVLNDIAGMIQLWLPFNLTVMLLWLSTAATTYITYRLAVIAMNFVGYVTKS